MKPIFYRGLALLLAGIYLAGSLAFANNACENRTISVADAQTFQLSLKQVLVADKFYDAEAELVSAAPNGQFSWKITKVTPSENLPADCQALGSLVNDKLALPKVFISDNSAGYSANFDLVVSNGAFYFSLKEIKPIEILQNSDGNIGQIGQSLTGVGSSFWTGIAIPVCWDTWNAGDTQARQWVQTAVSSTWEKYSAVRFYGWGQCNGFTDANQAIRIRVADENPRVTKLGKELRGVSGGMILNFTYAVWTGATDGMELCADGGRIPDGFWGSGTSTHREFCSKAIAVHEFGHALGFTHEDHRSDRFGCDEPHTAQGTKGDYLITAYDLDSVMNYCNPNWNGNGQLSFSDRWGVMSIYGGWSPDFAITPNNAAATKTSLAIASRDSGDLNLFYQGSDRAIATAWSNSNVGNGAWQPPSAITASGAARAETSIAAVPRNEQLHVFYIGSDGALASTWTNGGPWATPFPITPPGAARADSPLVAVVRGDQLHVFYIGPDGALATTWAAPNVNNGNWNSPFPINAPGSAMPGSKLDALVRGTQLHVFFEGNDQALATLWAASDFDNGRWQASFPVTPPRAAIASSALDAVVHNGDLHLFYQGADGALASTWAPAGGNWQAPFPITPPGAGRLHTSIAAIARSTNKLDVHFIGPDGAVATVWSNGLIDQGKWQTPFPVTPPAYARNNSELVATSRFGSTMDVFYTGQLGEQKTLWANDPKSN